MIMIISSKAGKGKRRYGFQSIKEGSIRITKGNKLELDCKDGCNEWIFLEVDSPEEDKKGGILSLNREMAHSLAVGILATLEELGTPIEIKFEEDKILR